MVCGLTMMADRLGFLCSFTGGDATDFSFGGRYTVGRTGGTTMVYIDLVMALNFAVDFLLLLGANSLAGHHHEYKRTVTAAALGGVYGGVCLMPGFRFLGGSFWRLVFLGLMALIAYGFDRSALRRAVLFVLLSMALGGIALGFQKTGMVSLIAAASGVSMMCWVGFPRKSVGATYQKVELEYKGKRRALVALLDTGNQLTDPVTGRQVLVVGADAARELLGLTEKQLSSPLDTILHCSGLRLIPYHGVGQPGGFLLAGKMDAVRMDGKPWDGMVAFAPQNFGNRNYEALAGGAI